MKPKPQELHWVGQSEARTWPEGSTVLLTRSNGRGKPRMDNSNILQVTVYFRPDLATPQYCDADSMYVLLALPPKAK